MTRTWGTPEFQQCAVRFNRHARPVVGLVNPASGETAWRTKKSVGIFRLDGLSAYLSDACKIAASRLTEEVADLLSPAFINLKTI